LLLWTHSTAAVLADNKRTRLGQLEEALVSSHQYDYANNNFTLTFPGTKGSGAKGGAEITCTSLSLRNTLNQYVSWGKALRENASNALQDIQQDRLSQVLALADEFDGKTHRAVMIQEVEDVRGAARVYCLCRSPYVEDSFMVACDVCDEWFHPRCVGLSEQQAEQLENFECPNCNTS